MRIGQIQAIVTTDVCSRCHSRSPRPGKKMCFMCGDRARTDAEIHGAAYRERKYKRFIAPLLERGCKVCGSCQGVRLKKMSVGLPQPTQLSKYSDEKILEMLEYYEVRCEKDYKDKQDE